KSGLHSFHSDIGQSVVLARSGGQMDPLTVVFAAIAMYANEIHDTERSSELRGIYLELMRLIEERYLGQNTLTTVNAYQNGDSSAQLTMVNAFHQLDAAGDEELLS